MLTNVGRWGDIIRNGRKPLAEFLDAPFLGPQIDNVMLRMLLWRHPLIPGDGFIANYNDEALLAAALDRLSRCSFVDITENEQLATNLQGWLGLPVSYPYTNETSYIPFEFRTPLHQQLNATTHEMLLARSRLDLRLWNFVAQRRLVNCDIHQVRERAILRNIARYGALMAA
jgi:hypothetical protein